MRNIPGFDEIRALRGDFDNYSLQKDYSTLAEREKIHNKIIPSLEEAVRHCGLKNGQTISFHHHFRGGDFIVNMVMDKLADMGFKNLVLAASSLTDCHEPLIKHIQNGVIRRIETSGLRGKLADAISHGLMDIPVVFRSHGGRAYAIETGELPIDVAFLGAPSCDPLVTPTVTPGTTREGSSAGLWVTPNATPNTRRKPSSSPTTSFISPTFPSASPKAMWIISFRWIRSGIPRGS